jgi:hypothetical protein
MWYAPPSSRIGRSACVGRGREVPSRGNYNTIEGDGGPGWYDVYDGIRSLRALVDDHMQLFILPVKAGNDRWGLRAVVRSEFAAHDLGAGGFGRAYPDGAKTMAAACWRATFAARIEAERLGLILPGMEYN